MEPRCCGSQAATWQPVCLLPGPGPIYVPLFQSSPRHRPQHPSPAPRRPGHFIANIGDILTRWTDGRCMPASLSARVEEGPAGG